MGAFLLISYIFLLHRLVLDDQMITVQVWGQPILGVQLALNLLELPGTRRVPESEL